MSAYDLSGNRLNDLYSKAGSAVATAYDVNGNVIFPDIDPEDYNFKVMSFNVQSWSGINGWDYIGEIFTDYDADIIGLQEASTNARLYNMGYLYNAVGTGPNTNIVYSKQALSDITSKSYDDNHYPGKRGYEKMYFTFAGKTIAFFNTHLETSTGTIYQYPQAAELFDAVSEEEYFILTGDLNTICTNTNDPSYINIVKPFVDAGYNVANCSPTWGFKNTWTDGSIWHATDNIITSSNIQMSNVVVDQSKLEIAAETGLTIDHLPIIAYLKI